MDRFTRFKLLRALWARAKNLLAWLVTPYEREARLRAQRWQQIQTAERQIRDGVARGAGDPDSDVRPPAPDYPEAWALQGQAAQEAQRLAYEAWQRQAQQRRN